MYRKKKIKKSVFENQMLFTNGKNCGIIKEVAEGRDILVDCV